MAFNWVYLANLRGPTGPVGPVAKAVRLEAGKWVWDLVGATHYVIPDHDGAMVVRPTAVPVPAATPKLDW